MRFREIGFAVAAVLTVRSAVAQRRESVVRLGSLIGATTAQVGEQLGKGRPSGGASSGKHRLRWFAYQVIGINSCKIQFDETNRSRMVEVELTAADPDDWRSVLAKLGLSKDGVQAKLEEFPYSIVPKCYLLSNIRELKGKTDQALRIALHKESGSAALSHIVSVSATNYGFR